MAKAGLNFMEAVLTSFWLSLYFSSWTLESALWDGGEGGMAGERESLFFQTTKTWRLVPDFSPGGQGFNMWIWRGCNSAPKDFQYLSWITLFFLNAVSFGAEAMIPIHFSKGNQDKDEVGAKMSVSSSLYLRHKKHRRILKVMWYFNISGCDYSPSLFFSLLLDCYTFEWHR